MCGATHEQKDLEAQQANFYKTLQASYSTAFGASTAILDTLTKSFQPILAAGIGQEGFTPEEKQARLTQATEGTAADYRKAGEAMNENIAAAGGGNEFLPFGGATQAREELAASGAAEQASAENQIEQENFATGRENYLTAAQILGGVANQYNPAGFASAATGAGSAAGQTADSIANAGNAWMGALGGLTGSVVGGWASGGFKH